MQKIMCPCCVTLHCQGGEALDQVAQRCPVPGYVWDQAGWALSSLVKWKASLPWQGSWNGMTFQVPSNPNHSMIPWFSPHSMLPATKQPLNWHPFPPAMFQSSHTTEKEGGNQCKIKLDFKTTRIGQSLSGRAGESLSALSIQGV